MGLYPQIKLADPSSLFGQCINKLCDIFITPLLQLRKFQGAYGRAMNDPASLDPWSKILQQLNTHLVVSDHDLNRIPKTGPLIVVANHPHGIMDGPLVGSLLHRVRDDFKIIINEAASMPGLEDRLLFVSIFGSSKQKAKKNIQVMREALEWLEAGHMIMVFPAGEISAIRNRHEKIALDNTWSAHMIRLSMRANAPILPLFIVGQNDALFLKLGLVHPLFRTLQIGRVTNQLCNQYVSIRVSQLCASKTLESMSNDDERIAFIRAQTYSLLSRETCNPRIFTPLDLDANDISAAFEILNQNSIFKIKQTNTYTVLLFSQQQLLELNSEYKKTFQVLRDEIGRLRELTFREIGEGSGQSRDLDQFDEYYSHLTLWDHQHKRLIGAYRIAFTDDVLPQYGAQGFYTAAQFDYDVGFFKTIGPAMEVSRAFIIKEYQKSAAGLSTLLGALAQVLVERPHIRSFFGAVSISNDFQTISKKLILAYLAKYHGDPTLTHLVSAKNPPHMPIDLPLEEWQCLLGTVKNLSLLNTLISGIEPDGKEIPPLIPTYISLMGRFIAFDYDVHFNSIDGLLVINMHEAMQESATIMRRLLGKSSYDRYWVHKP